MISHMRRLLSLSTAMVMASTAIAAAEPSAELIAAAKAEGTLTTIALPHDWCGYGGVIEGFKAKYGLTVNELNPDAGSGDEIEAIKANKDNKGDQAPDVIDVGLSFGPSAKAEKPDPALQGRNLGHDPGHRPRMLKATGMATITAFMAFEVNKDLVKERPKDWADLLKPEYANMVALAGDPRTANQAISGVFAAGLSAAGGDVAKAGEAGLAFFKELNSKGNFVPVIGKSAPLAQGTTPIILRWDYNALADRDTLAGNPPVDVVVPATGVVAGVYVQAISAYAPHPNAAKLWMEYLYSDEGQLGWLKGYCHPIRFNDLAKNGKIPQDLLDKLPPAAAYEKAVFPTLEEQEAYKEVITKGWDSVVGANVQ